MTLTQSILSECISYSPIRQQWLIAFNTDGTVEGLIPRAWHNTKLEALRELKSALQFREGLVADCSKICARIDRINREINKLERRVRK